MRKPAPALNRIAGRLMLYDRTSSTIKSLTESFDRHVESFLWTPDSKALFLIAGDEARQPVFKVDLSWRPGAQGSGFPYHRRRSAIT